MATERPNESGEEEEAFERTEESAKLPFAPAV
jgi:hypothetical protein